MASPRASESVRAIDAERDGFAAMLGAFQRQVARDVQAGVVSDAAAALIRRRVATMVEQVGLGLHLVAAGVDDQHVPAKSPRIAAHKGGAA